MEEVFENKLLDDLYQVRGEGIELEYIKKYGKPKKMLKADKEEKKFVDMLQKQITDSKIISKLMEQYNNAELAMMGEYCFWFDKLYKLGFVDGMNFKTEMKEVKEELDFTNDYSNSIIYKKIDEVSDLIEEQKYKNLKAREDYNELMHKMEKIKDKYPKVRAFFEDEEIAEYTKEELQALLKLTGLYFDLALIEKDEMFRIGLKEGKLL